MVINNQTLFYIYKDVEDKIHIFDLKTLTKLDFKDTNQALHFCQTFGEYECIDELKNNRIHTADYLYLDTNSQNAKHRIVSICYTKRIEYVSSDKLVELTRCNKIANVAIGTSGKLRIKWLTPPTEDAFKNKIANLYTNFINSSRLLGKEQPFKYVVIGKYVIQTKLVYSPEIYVPEFVTSISDYINFYPTIFKLSDGVKFIGSDVINKDTQLLGGKNLKYIGNMDRLTNVQILKR